jgi:hypothetical protein
MIPVAVNAGDSVLSVAVMEIVPAPENTFPERGIEMLQIPPVVI